MSLAQKAGKAATLLIFRKGWSTLVNLGVMAILARQLNKEDFGIVAISSVFLSLVSSVGIGGLGDYIIFYKDQHEGEIRQAIFWLNLLVTFLIVIPVFGLAHWWASFYGSPGIEQILYLITITFIFEMLSTVPRSILRRQLDYQAIVTITTIFGTTISIGKVAFALTGWGVYSIILPSLIITPIQTAVFYYQAKFTPTLNLCLHRWQEVVKYVKYVAGGQLITKLVNEGDTLIVGKLLGMEKLGVYNLAFGIGNIFKNQVLPIVTEVTLPTFSKIAHDQERLRNAFIKLISVIALISFPTLFILQALAEPFVLFLYGPKWSEAIIPLQILIIFTVSRSISSPSSGLYFAVGKPNYGFYFALIFAPIFFISIYVGSYWGLLGICYAVTIARLLGGQVNLVLCCKLIKLDVRILYQVMKPFLLAAIVAALVVYFTPKYFSHFFVLVVYSILGAIIYILILRLFFKSDLVRILNSYEVVHPHFKYFKKILLLNKP